MKNQKLFYKTKNFYWEKLQVIEKDKAKAIVLLILFTTLFYFSISYFARGGDFLFHLQKASGNCFENNCLIYAPLFHWLGAPFAFHENAFMGFALLIIGVITPWLLFKQEKNWLTVWFYFTTSSYFWFFIDGIYSQALAHVFFLAILVNKEFKYDVLFLGLATLAHGHGFYLAALAILGKNLFHALKEDKWFLPACSGVFGHNSPEVLTQQVNGLMTHGQPFTIANILLPFTKIYPFFYWFLSVFQVFKERRWETLFLVGSILILGLLISHRIFYLIPLLLIPGLVRFTMGTSVFGRRIVLGSSLLVFGFQLFSWVNFKLLCT